RLLALLDRLGDRAGALSAYEEFARHLGQDFDVEPAAETQALMRAIRGRDETVVAPTATPPDTVGSYRPPPAVVRAAAPAEPAPAPPIPTVGREPLGTGRVAMLALGVLVLLGAGV